MVEPAFGLLKTRINELLIDGQAQPARSSGAEAFEADPKSLTGSLLRIKEGSAVNGIGRYATVRQCQGLRTVADSGQQELKVSIAGPDFVRPIAASLASRGDNPEQRISLTDDATNLFAMTWSIDCLASERPLHLR